MRLLDPRQTQVKLEDMGMDKKLFDVTMGEIAKPNGLILTTGPTGSGKTTTLYAFLRKLYNPELKIITIEDPIEYHLGGITQTQVEHDKNYDFLSGLRAALRQDPDVIMIGEIRDAETAQTAIDAALTGHLVFSTLHTNNAAGVIPRLIQLNVNPKIISSALTLSIAQRLVRVLCTTCKKQAVLAGDDEKLVRDIIQQGITEGKDFAKESVTPDQILNVYEPVGCEKCNNTGFKGRIGVFEIIKTDEEIEKVTDENPSEREIKKIAEHQHIFDMKEDGIIKVLKGITSLAELRTSVDLLED
jgi:type II secretory ATPase GspE/PulE/Tfp pilus assembly ATPase PilB-like protein